jgi:hypothetical protein
VKGLNDGVRDCGGGCSVQGGRSDRLIINPQESPFVTSEKGSHRRQIQIQIKYPKRVLQRRLQKQPSSLPSLSLLISRRRHGKRRTEMSGITWANDAAWGSGTYDLVARQAGHEVLVLAPK